MKIDTGDIKRESTDIKTDSRDECQQTVIPRPGSHVSSNWRLVVRAQVKS
jgi:hypothetical protein